MSGVSTFFYLFHKPENNPPRLGTIHPPRRPVCGPSTHFGCEEGPHKSVEFTLLRTGGITFKTEIPLSGSV